MHTGLKTPVEGVTRSRRDRLCRAKSVYLHFKLRRTHKQHSILNVKIYLKKIR